MRVIILHIPRISQNTMFVTVMPIGLLGMASYVREHHGHTTKVANRAMYRSSGAFLDMVIEFRPDLVGLSLHWHHQLHSVLTFAREWKRVRPRTPVVVGGYTASYFARQIVEKYNEIDFVVSGDGEEPLGQLATAIEYSSPYDTVPNLTFRKNGVPRKNRHTWSADGTTLDGLIDDSFETLVDGQNGYVDHIKTNMREREQALAEKQPRVFYLPIGRGCVYNCVFCAGSTKNHERLYGRCGYVNRSPEAVAETIVRVSACGFESVYVCDLIVDNEQWMRRLFRLLQEKQCKVGFQIELYNLWTHDLLWEFLTTVDLARSCIVLSPDFFQEIDRFRFTCKRFDNEELASFVRLCEKSNVSVQVYFLMTMSEEDTDLDLFDKKVDFASSLVGKRTSVQIQSVTIEPGSPQHERPKAYNLRQAVTTLDEFVALHSHGIPNRLGYDLPEQGLKQRFANSRLFRLTDLKSFNRKILAVPDSERLDLLANVDRRSFVALPTELHQKSFRSYRVARELLTRFPLVDAFVPDSRSST